MFVKSNEIGVQRALDIAALGAAILNLYKLPYFSTLSLTRQRKKNSNGSTSKFILYVIKRLHAKIGACIRPPVTINTLSDLTKCLSQYIQFRVVDMDICKLLGYGQFTITNTITIYLTSSMKKGNKSLLGKQTNKYLQPSQYVPVLFPILLYSLPLQSE